MSKNPKILRKVSDSKVKESGCCFTSCGGSPMVLQDEAYGKKKTTTVKMLGKI